MQSIGSGKDKVKDSGSSELDINESFIRSDIEKIIKKMYSPEPERHVFGNTLQTNDNEVPVRDSDCASIKGCNSFADSYGSSQNQRCGFYYQSYRRNDVKTLMIDSSTSDSISLPQLRHKLRQQRVVCECCKRKIIRFHERVSRCKACTEPEIRLKKEQPLVYLGQGDKVSTSKIKQVNHVCQENLEHHQCAEGIDQKLQSVLVSKFLDQPLPNKVQLEKSCMNITSVNANSENIKDLTGDQAETFNLSKPTIKRTTLNTNFQSSAFESQLKQVCNKKETIKAPSASAFGRIKTNFNNWSLCFTQRKHQSQNDSIVQVGIGNLQTKESRKEKYSEMFEFSKSKAQNQVQNNHFASGETSSFAVAQKDQKECSNQIETMQSNLSQSLHRSVGKDIDYKMATVKKPSASNKPKDLFQEAVGLNLSRTTFNNFEKYEETEEAMEYVKTSKSNEPFYYFSFDKIDETFNENTKSSQTEDHCISTETFVKTSWAAKFWTQTFGSFGVVVDFFTTFILQLLKFSLHTVVHPLFCGSLQIWSDYFFKPCLAVLFSSVIQPIVGFFQNVAKASSDMCLPIAECFGHFTKQMSALCSSCRLVEVNKTYHKSEELKIP